MKTRILLATLLGCAMLTTGMFGTKPTEESAATTNQPAKEKYNWDQFKKDVKKIGRATGRGFFKVTGNTDKRIRSQATGIKDLKDKIDLIPQWIIDHLNQYFKDYFEAELGVARAANKEKTEISATAQLCFSLINWGKDIQNNLSSLASDLKNQATKLKAEGKDAGKIDPIQTNLDEQVNQYKHIGKVLGKALEEYQKHMDNFDINKFNITYEESPAAQPKEMPAPAPNPVVAPAPEPVSTAAAAPAAKTTGDNPATEAD